MGGYVDDPLDYPVGSIYFCFPIVISIKRATGEFS